MSAVADQGLLQNPFHRLVKSHGSLQKFNEIRKKEDGDECPALLSEELGDCLDEFSSVAVIVGVVDLAQ